MNAGGDGRQSRGTKLTNNDVQPSTQKRDWAVVALPFVPADVRRSSGQELRGRLMRGRRFDWSIACAGKIQSFGRRISR